MGKAASKAKTAAVQQLAKDPSKFQAQMDAALQANDDKKVKVFIEGDKQAGFVLNYITVVHLAAEHANDEAKCWDLVQASDKVNINAIHPDTGNSPLMTAIVNGKKVVINKLLEAKAKTDITNKAGQTAAQLLEANQSKFGDSFAEINGKLSGGGSAAAAAAPAAAATDAAAASS
eukprot:GILI01016571.1.p1 GENE.GILI01016571.1~~GILI01016571.1.p1  ORF type:complete len:175 (-),score=63.98 GILI01016571.1:76-600(-)